MGGIFSSNANGLDGLGHQLNHNRTCTLESKRKLQHLLAANISAHRFNRLAPTLVSAFYLGATANELTTLYNTIAEELDPWPEDAPLGDSVSSESLQEYFGRQDCEQRYFEFFRDELTETPDPRTIVWEYLPRVLYGLCGNEFEPLVQLACAFEVGNHIMTTEALAMACTSDAAEPIDLASIDLDAADAADDITRLLTDALALSPTNPRPLEVVLALHQLANLKTKPIKDKRILYFLVGRVKTYIQQETPKPQSTPNTTKTWDEIIDQGLQKPKLLRTIRALMLAEAITGTPTAQYMPADVDFKWVVA